jgi:arsenite methyltransferase
MEESQIKEMVRARYGAIAETASGGGSCCASAASCCGPITDPNSKSKSMGYSDAELRVVPEGANLGLGCGNPPVIATGMSLPTQSRASDWGVPAVPAAVARTQIEG